VQTGQLMTRITSDVENVRQFSGQGLLNLLSATLTLIGTVVVLVVLNARLAGISFAMVPVIFAIFGVLVTRIFPLFRRIQQRLGALNAILQENLAGVAVVKAFTREDYERGRYERANQDLLGENLRVITAITAAFPVIFLVANLGNLAVVWYGGDQVIAQKLSLGTLVAFTTYLSFLLMPVFQLGFISAMMSRAGASAARVFEVLDAESEVSDRPGARQLGRIEGRIGFDHVSFRYVGQEKNILDDISFEIEPGQTVALVGSTGSGKSTLINLIPRFYDVRGGAIRIDGVDIRDVTLSSLRSRIGIALQESTLFGGTIRDNIAFGRPDATMEEIIAAATTAQAHEFVMGFPEGYETEVGERGVTVSGGQRQRLSIARTLLVDPRILLLDDATSSVDAETEYRLQQALEGLMEGRTSLVIAHRISTVRRADRILVLDGGRLVADGTHDDLLCTSPLYGEIVDSQLSGVRP
jgi:ATP-binding cassette subfamily B multidrug efflux pump